MAKRNRMIENSLFHTLELGSYASSNKFFESYPIVMNDSCIDNMDYFFSRLAGNTKYEPSVYQIIAGGDLKGVKTSKNIGYFGLSVSALSSEFPLRTFNEWSLNCGLILDRKSPKLKVLVASPCDLFSQTSYDEKGNNLRISFDSSLTPPAFVEAVRNSGGKKLESPYLSRKYDHETMEYYYFDEKAILNNPINYSVKDMVDFIKSHKSFDEYNVRNRSNGWNEVVVAARIEAVTGIFFSSDFKAEELETASKKFGPNFARDSQLANALCVASALHKGVDNGFGKTYSKYLPIYEYKREKCSLTQIDIATEKPRIMKEYGATLSDRFKNMLSELPAVEPVSRPGP